MSEADLLTAPREHVARLANRLPLMDHYAVDLEEIENTFAALAQATGDRLGEIERWTRCWIT